MKTPTPILISLAVLAFAGTADALAGQLPGPAPQAAPTPPLPEAVNQEDLRRHLARLDSIQAEIQRVSEEQVEAIRRITQGREAEMDALRRELNAQAESIRQAQDRLLLEERRLTEAQRGEIEAVRARMLEESRRLSQAAAELARLQGARRETWVRVGPDSVRVALPNGGVAPGWGFESGAVGLRGPGEPSTAELRSLEYATGLPGTWTSVGGLNLFGVGLRAIAGASLTTLTPALGRYFEVESGVLVTEVADGSPAQESGLEPGDVIVAVNGEPVEAAEELRRVLSPPFTVTYVLNQAGAAARGGRGPEFRSQTAGAPEPILLRIVREGETREIELER